MWGPVERHGYLNYDAAMNRLPVISAPPAKSSIDRDPPHHTENFGLLALYMITMRTGWIFKTESIIMPAVLDVIGGAGWLRGCLPMLNRFGQSVPPMLASSFIRSTPLKKRTLTAMTRLMSVCFLVLSGVWAWTDGQSSGWLPFAFLAMYAIFFAATGVNMLLLNTLKGKLIRVRRRGLLDLVSNLVGAAVAISCAWFLLTRWLDSPTAAVGQTVGQPLAPNFTMIFLFTGLMFALASVIGGFFFEVPDEVESDGHSSRQIYHAAMETFLHDHNFRRLAIIGMMFGMSLTLFPHYQSMGRSRLSLSLTALIPWLIAQNLGTALFSVPSGWVADRFGNRRVLNVLMLALCVAPMLSLFLSRTQAVDRDWFNVVFVLLGLTPVTIRTLNNYTLEICEPDDRPRYLSTLGLCIAAPPVLMSAFMGGLVDSISFEFVFLIGAACVFTGWLLTFSLIEPRHSR